MASLREKNQNSALGEPLWKTEAFFIKKARKTVPVQQSANMHFFWTTWVPMTTVSKQSKHMTKEQ